MMCRRGVCSIDEHAIDESMGRCADAPDNVTGCANCWLASWYDKMTPEELAELALKEPFTSW